MLKNCLLIVLVAILMVAGCAKRTDPQPSRANPQLSPDDPKPPSDDSQPPLDDSLQKAIQKRDLQKIAAVIGVDANKYPSSFEDSTFYRTVFTMVIEKNLSDTPAGLRLSDLSPKFVHLLTLLFKAGAELADLYGAVRNMYIKDIKEFFLHRLAFSGLKNWVKLLLDNKKVDVNEEDKDSLTALHYAARNGHEAVVEVLLNRDAAKDARSKLGLTALHYAARNGHETVVEVLLDKGTDVNVSDKAGLTALHYAARNDHEAVVEFLLAHGVDVNASDKAGRTALHDAAKNGYETVVNVLLAHGATKDARDKNGNTPLYYAEIYKHEVVKVVLWRNGR